MIVRIAILWYLLGLMVFYTAATFPYFHYNTWSYSYYLWAKASDILLLLSLRSRPKNSSEIFPILIFAGIRFAWEIISLITGIKVNDTRVIGILFIILILLCLFIIIKETRWRKLKY